MKQLRGNLFTRFFNRVLQKVNLLAENMEGDVIISLKYLFSEITSLLRTAKAEEKATKEQISSYTNDKSRREVELLRRVSRVPTYVDYKAISHLQWQKKAFRRVKLITETRLTEGRVTWWPSSTRTMFSPRRVHSTSTYRGTGAVLRQDGGG